MQDNAIVAGIDLQTVAVALRPGGFRGHCVGMGSGVRPRGRAQLSDCPWPHRGGESNALKLTGQKAKAIDCSEQIDVASEN